MKKTYSTPEVEITTFSIKEVLSASYPVEDNIEDITNPYEPVQPTMRPQKT